MLKESFKLLVSGPILQEHNNASRMLKYLSATFEMFKHLRRMLFLIFSVSAQYLEASLYSKAVYS